MKTRFSDRVRHPLLTAALLCSALNAGEVFAQSNGPDGRAFGLGLAVLPTYPGAKDYHVLPFPNAQFSHGAFFIQGLQLGARYSLTPNVDIGPLLGLQVGRDDSDADKLAGLGNIATSLDAGAFVRWHSGPAAIGLSFHQSAHSGYGNKVTLDAAYVVFRSARDSVRVAASSDWSNGAAMQTWYGVSTGQAQSSQAGLREYHPAAGFSRVSGELQWQHQITRTWALHGSIGVASLIGDASDSPIVERRTAPYGNVGLSYRF